MEDREEYAKSEYRLVWLIIAFIFIAVMTTLSFHQQGMINIRQNNKNHSTDSILFIHNREIDYLKLKKPNGR